MGQWRVEKRISVIPCCCCGGAHTVYKATQHHPVVQHRTRGPERKWGKAP